jgi:chromosome segregation ATPase
MVLDELEAQREEMDETELVRYAALPEDFQSLQEDHPAALESKSKREAGSRLNLWRAYVQDIEASNTGAWQYRTEVRQRVMLARLLDLMRDHSDLDDLRKAISALDRRLRPRFEAGDFVWDERLTPIYPYSRYWFLYGKPKTGE